ncbi:MAG TPA: STAS domain-containing protein [Candidatus Sulfotelmatobacter sp.]|jgi:hypothetical protein|nr:STAS domain-containing protein [Candidatus Sulfotelmatobacter sp.]
MTTGRTILAFPSASEFGSRRIFKRSLRNALRVSEFSVIVDFTGHGTLDHEDIDLLLECVAQSTDRDTQLELVAGSRAVRIVLDVIRISSLVRVFNSLDEALTQSQMVASKLARNVPAVPFELPRSA